MTRTSQADGPVGSDRSGTDGSTDSEQAGLTRRLLVGIGSFAVELERYYPNFVRKNFGARLFLLAAIVIVGGPVAAIVVTDDVVTAAVIFGHDDPHRLPGVL
ncbi:MAG: hypothetical protein ABEI99_10490 [Halobaculum sp.]